MSTAVLSRQESSASSDGSPTPRRPRVLGRRYELLRRLGQGSFGVAYIVRDVKAEDGEDMKVLKEIFIGTKLPDNGLDAVREAKLLSKLSHPNIVKYHSSFVQGEVFCIVTEYCDNGDLNMLIKRVEAQKKHFEEKLVVTYLVQLLMAVKYMHDRKLLHRDIKASNIFLRNNVIKLGDFGITRLLERTDDMASTFTGTPNYMSPEVVQHEGYDSKSDIWSLGCVLYEMCALQVAFKATNLLGLMKKIVYEATPVLPDSYSQDLRDIFDMMMVKDTAQRSSATNVLRHHYIVRHVSSLKEQIVEQQAAAATDASEIAEALSGYSHSRKERKKEVRSKAEATAAAPTGDVVGKQRKESQSSAAPAAVPASPTAKASPRSSQKTNKKSGVATKEKVSMPKAKAPAIAKSKGKTPARQASDSSRAGVKAPGRAVADPAPTTPKKKKKADKLPPKRMTPREQLEYRKRLRADEEAGRLKREVGKQYEELQRSYDKNRRQNNVERPPPWVAENPDICRNAHVFSPSRAAKVGNDSNSYRLDDYEEEDYTSGAQYPSPGRKAPSTSAAAAVDGGDVGDQYALRDFVSQNDFDEMPVGGRGQQPLPPPMTSPDTPPTAFVLPPNMITQDRAGQDSRRFHFDAHEAGNGESIDITFDDITLDADITMVTEKPESPTLKAVSGEVSGGAIGRAASSRAGVAMEPSSEHYIPEDPDEADDLYTRNDDFESFSDNEFDSDSDSDYSKGGNGMGAAAADGVDGGTYGTEDKGDLAALAQCLNKALALTTLGDGATAADVLSDSDDVVDGVTATDAPVLAKKEEAPERDIMSPGNPQHRVRQLKRGCIQLFGEEAFQKVYTFLKESRYGPKPLTDAETRVGLGKLVPSARDCFLVDQLLFLEHQTQTREANTAHS